ncbi:hypothetical protein GCM10022237_51410 [Nocardioides ginsengisoli]|uniref:Uncharacterized protein n=1 Tax=Nocardioides ginsengisoli TaxID=363868 RepID=A0ABW3VV47_9ACTN
MIIPMLPELFTGFIVALSQSTPTGLALVESAIDRAIKEIETATHTLKPADFDAHAFIPKPAFGTADRSAELALHHQRAHSVMKETLDGVLEDLHRFKDACALARADIKGVDGDAGAALLASTRAVESLGNADTDHGDTAYDNAVQSAAGADGADGQGA